MEWQHILDTFARMPLADQQTWWRGAAGLLALVLVLLSLESRFFKRSGRVRSWLTVRLVSAVAALFALAAVVLPARPSAALWHWASLSSRCTRLRR